MRTMLIALTLIAGVLTFVPSADAVGTCSELKDHYCDDYLICVGYQTGSYGFRCTGYGVRDPTGPCTCPPPRDPL